MREFLPLALFFLAAVAPAAAQQFNKTVDLAPYVPTPQAIVDKMLHAGRVKPGEMVYDLGSGDGRIVITAAQKFGAHAVGVELSPELCHSTTARIKALGLESKVRIVNDNLLNVDLSPADVVTIYLLTSSNDRLRPNLERDLKPGARVVSNDFEIRGWKPSEIIHQTANGASHTIYLYEVARKK